MGVAAARRKRVREGHGERCYGRGKGRSGRHADVNAGTVNGEGKGRRGRRRAWLRGVWTAP